MRRALAVLVLAAAATAGAAEPPDALRKEAQRRNEALVKDAFNLTRGFHFGAETAPIKLEIIIPASEEHTVALWLETQAGEASLRVLAADGRPVAAVAGRSGEARVTAELASGKYLVELDRGKAGSGEALLGIKGGVVVPCDVDGARLTEVPAAPSAGFSWPYLLFVPEQVRSTHLLVIPNSTGFATDDIELLRGSASCSVRGDSAMAAHLGAVLLVPLFPRPAIGGEEDNLYLHALVRAALERKAAPATTRVDLQLLAMVRDARTRLKARGLDAGGKLLLSGFSASGSFVNRFAMLHPAEVLAVACGSPGGWPLAPATDVGGVLLPYPVGVGDVAGLTGEPVDLQAARAVHWYFFLGDRDANDAVPHRDSFSRADEELVFRRFGKTPVARWKAAERLYAAGKLDARFVLYPGVAHQVTPQMRADIEKFFADAQRL